MSTRIFEKVANENLSDHRETTPNHGFCGPGKEQKRERRERRGERLCNLLSLYWQLWHSQRSMN